MHIMHAYASRSAFQVPALPEPLRPRPRVTSPPAPPLPPPAPASRSLKSLYPSADIFRIIFRRPKLLLLTPDRIRSDAQEVGPAIGAPRRVPSPWACARNSSARVRTSPPPFFPRPSPHAHHHLTAHTSGFGPGLG